MGNTRSRPQPEFEGSSTFPTQLHYYHCISRVLSRGSPGNPRKGVPRRPPLPTELVILILREAGATVRSRDLSCVFPRGVSPRDIERRAGTLQSSVWATASNQEVARYLLFASPAIDAPSLPRLAWLQVDTFSKDQGWCSDPSSGGWSWFETGILRSSEGHNMEVDPQEVLFPRRGRVLPNLEEHASENLVYWESHRNPVAGREYAWINGARFGPDDEIWSSLQPGDRIGVWLCAQYPGWQCVVKAAKITVYEWFEPTLL
ncbi:hypothetical protein M407DRAFT_124153 [Tulasnella calospora MUT 4182]|uniref:Uncharacterized protein n=1 Tax=Tulasnella calospora MUT 4182 TaxID=1051891 RepID=A0A0C3QS55_9AGAM|nr:hypothetical protein M407DRAFT_124153 [Tulasnella calospora MUT 4182]